MKLINKLYKYTFTKRKNGKKIKFLVYGISKEDSLDNINDLMPNLIKKTNEIFKVSLYCKVDVCHFEIIKYKKIF